VLQVPHNVADEQFVQFNPQVVVVHKPVDYKKYEALQTVQAAEVNAPVVQNVRLPYKVVLQTPFDQKLYPVAHAVHETPAVAEHVEQFDCVGVLHNIPIVKHYCVDETEAQTEHYQMFVETYVIQFVTGEYAEHEPPERANPAKQAVHAPATVTEHVAQFKPVAPANTHVLAADIQYVAAHVAHTTDVDNVVEQPVPDWQYPLP
jgi:hypothetical protein